PDDPEGVERKASTRRRTLRNLKIPCTRHLPAPVGPGARKRLTTRYGRVARRARAPLGQREHLRNLRKGRRLSQRDVATVSSNKLETSHRDLRLPSGMPD